MTEQNLGWCKPEGRAHKLIHFRLLKLDNERYAQLRCVYCKEILKNHG